MLYVQVKTTGPSEMDYGNDLQYCSPLCHRSIRLRGKDYHKSKVLIIQQSIEEKYSLTHLDKYQAPKLGGASLLKQLQIYANHSFKAKLKEKIPGRTL